MRTLAETGNLYASDSEARTQMREQKIAKELGRTPGKDFPDVFESGPYTVKLHSPQKPSPAPTDNSAPPIDPTGYEGGTLPVQTRPIFSRQSDNWPARGLTSAPTSTEGIALRNTNARASSPDSEGPIGLFSGKPMRFPFAPIFDTPAPSSTNRDINRR
jgi:hypothetical protein